MRSFAAPGSEKRGKSAPRESKYIPQLEEGAFTTSFGQGGVARTVHEGARLSGSLGRGGGVSFWSISMGLARGICGSSSD